VGFSPANGCLSDGGVSVVVSSVGVFSSGSVGPRCDLPRDLSRRKMAATATIAMTAIRAMSVRVSGLIVTSWSEVRVTCAEAEPIEAVAETV